MLLKLSGEALGGNGGTGINIESIRNIACEIKKALRDTKIQLAIVVGGGNIWRGAGKDIERVTADYMGMLATVINALALRDVLESNGLPSVVQSAVDISKLAEPYSRDNALKCLKENRIVIFAAGTGNPFFTTDTTSALRAAEIGADVLLKATQVDGVYSDDPKKNPNATKYPSIKFDEAIRRNLRIMDTAAFSLCRENNMPIIVFNFHAKGNLAKVLAGAKIGTLVD